MKETQNTKNLEGEASEIKHLNFTDKITDTIEKTQSKSDPEAHILLKKSLIRFLQSRKWPISQKARKNILPPSRPITGEKDKTNWLN